jgi:hypothetical protein
MYNNLMNEFKWGNMHDPDVYIDENNARMMTNIRNNFNRLAQQLVAEGKNEQAVEVVERGMELVPSSVVPYEFFSLDMINSLYMAQANGKAQELAEKSLSSYTDMLSYLFSLNPRFLNSGDVSDEMQKNLFYLQKLERIASTAGDEAWQKKRDQPSRNTTPGLWVPTNDVVCTTHSSAKVYPEMVGQCMVEYRPGHG